MWSEISLEKWFVIIKTKNRKLRKYKVKLISFKEINISLKNLKLNICNFSVTNWDYKLKIHRIVLKWKIDKSSNINKNAKIRQSLTRNSSSNLA